MPHISGWIVHAAVQFSSTGSATKLSKGIIMWPHFSWSLFSLIGCWRVNPTFLSGLLQQLFHCRPWPLSHLESLHTLGDHTPPAPFHTSEDWSSTAQGSVETCLRQLRLSPPCCVSARSILLLGRWVSEWVSAMSQVESLETCLPRQSLFYPLSWFINCHSWLKKTAKIWFFSSYCKYVTSPAVNVLALHHRRFLREQTLRHLHFACRLQEQEDPVNECTQYLICCNPARCFFKTLHLSLKDSL